MSNRVARFPRSFPKVLMGRSAQREPPDHQPEAHGKACSALPRLENPGSITTERKCYARSGEDEGIVSNILNMKDFWRFACAESACRAFQD